MSESAQDGRGCACQDFSRSELLRRGVVAAGRGLPAIEPGMPTPAGTGLSRRSFVLASAGLALTVYGAGRLIDPAAFSEGIAAAATVSASQPVLVSVYLQGGIDSMSVLYPDRRPAVHAISQRPRRGTRRRTAVRGGPGARAGTRWRPRSQQLHARGQGQRDADGRLHRPQPVALHEPPLLGGRRDAGRPQTGWMGRYLDVVGTADNPLQGLSLDYALQPSLATARMPVATISSPLRVLVLRAGGVGGPAEHDV